MKDHQIALLVFRLIMIMIVILKNHHIPQDGGNSNMFGIFIPNFGEEDPILTSIFFKWVGSTTNQFMATQGEFLHSWPVNVPPPNVPPRQREGCNKAWLDKGNQWFS